MVDRFVVQASGCMFSTGEPSGWTYAFAVYVTDQDGAPVTGLTKSNFAVWGIAHVTLYDFWSVDEMSQVITSSHLAGVYRVQTKETLSVAAPSPQQFVFAIRVHKAEPNPQNPKSSHTVEASPQCRSHTKATTADRLSHQMLSTNRCQRRRVRNRCPRTCNCFYCCLRLGDKPSNTPARRVSRRQTPREMARFVVASIDVVFDPPADVRGVVM
jgi:hypothetical protein